MDDPADPAVLGDPSSGDPSAACSAASSAAGRARGPARRVDDARRMVPREVGPDGLQRLAEFAARLLGTPVQPDLAAHRRPGRRRGVRPVPRIGRAGSPAGGVALHRDRAAAGGPRVVVDAPEDERVHGLPRSHSARWAPTWARR